MIRTPYTMHRSGRSPPLPSFFNFAILLSIITEDAFPMKKLAVITALSLTFATGAFAESFTGYVSDAMCAKDPHKVASADHAACAQKCMKGGEKPVLVVGEKVYTITNPDTLVNHAGHKVTVDGQVKGDALTVKSVKM